MACLDEVGTSAETTELFIMERMVGPTEMWEYCLVEL